MIARATPTVVDLGTGSGSLAERILAVRPKARLIGIDADPVMLATATRRLRGRIETIEGNFERTSIPACDVVSASFALHHIATSRRKAALYQRCFSSLRSGGMFVSGIVQYNSAGSSVGSNVRFRWEYRPGSELFVVYTDDFNTDELRPNVTPLRNRAWVIKFNRLFRL